MKNITTLAKADQLTTESVDTNKITIDKPIEDIEIHIKSKLPKFENFKEMDNFYSTQATFLHKALVKHLPQATTTRLLVLLLESNAVYYRGKLK